MLLIDIAPRGTTRFIWNDDLQPLTTHGDTHIERASHVEPNESGQWVADLSPVNGPKLGPFVHRRDALDAEVEWLEVNLFGRDAA